MTEPGRLAEMPIAAAAQRALGPLNEPLFRTLWVAAVISYSGTWMQNVGAAWLMTSLTMSPLMVGLVQAAGSIAVFLVVLPAGAIADMVDRRKLLLFTQTWMVAAAVALAALTSAGRITPDLLLLLTLAMGVGAVLNDPAWQAITPEIVSHRNFAAGVALNSAGFNVARAIGPALGGLVIAAAGSGMAFLLNATSFFGVIYFLYQWQRRPRRMSFRTGHMVQAMISGVRHMSGSRSVKAVLVRSAAFSISASALPALLPLLAHPFGSQGYGLLLGLLRLRRSARRSVNDRFAAKTFRRRPGLARHRHICLRDFCRRQMAQLCRAVPHDVHCRSCLDPDSRQPQCFGANHVSGANARPCDIDVSAGAAGRACRGRGIVGRGRGAGWNLALVVVCCHRLADRGAGGSLVQVE